MRKRNDIYIYIKDSDDFRASPLLHMFSNCTNLLKRDTYPSAKLLKNIEIGAICGYKNHLRCVLFGFCTAMCLGNL